MTCVKMCIRDRYYDIDDVLLTESLARAQGEGTLDLLEWFCK